MNSKKYSATYHHALINSSLTFNNYHIMKKYFATRAEAIKERDRRLKLNPFSDIHVYKMPKGSRRAGQYAVCTELEYLNTY